MNHYFPNRYDICKPKKGFHAQHDEKLFNENFSKDLNYKYGFKLLNQLLKEKGEFIPPLINIYMRLSDTMITFGSAKNPDFGNVEEIGILIKIDDIHKSMKDRHLNY